MADNQRPYRPNDSFGRAPAPGPAPAHGGSDPLAELARLIGQNDPFSEFGHSGAQRRAPQQQLAAEPQQPEWGARQQQPPFAQRDPRAPRTPENYASDYSHPAQNAPQAHDPQGYGAQQYDRYEQPQFAAAPFAPGADVYRTGQEGNGFDDHQHGAQYAQDSYFGNPPREQHSDEEIYDDAPPARRRFSVMAIAGVCALAVVGTAGAFGYRAIFGSPSSGQPPVIKADTAPSKIVPALATDQQKAIQDRVGSGGIERLVSREEQPVERPAGTIGGSPAIGSGVVSGTEPKKIRTIVIHPDTQASATEPGQGQPATATVRPQQAAQPAQQAAQPRVTNAPIIVVDPESGKPRQQQAATTARATPAIQQAAAPARQQTASANGGNAPLSLTPDAGADQAPARAVRTAATSNSQPVQLGSQQAASASSGGGGNYVQLSSQRSEAEAQAAFRNIQGKYPTQLSGRSAVIRSVTLGDKGTYYRAMVGPFASAGEASQLCESLKAAGGQCVVQRN